MSHATPHAIRFSTLLFWVPRVFSCIAKRDPPRLFSLQCHAAAKRPESYSAYRADAILSYLTKSKQLITYFASYHW